MRAVDFLIAGGLTAACLSPIGVGVARAEPQIPVKAAMLWAISKPAAQMAIVDDFCAGEGAGVISSMLGDTARADYRDIRTELLVSFAETSGTDMELEITLDNFCYIIKE